MYINTRSYGQIWASRKLSPVEWLAVNWTLNSVSKGLAFGLVGIVAMLAWVSLTGGSNSTINVVVIAILLIYGLLIVWGIGGLVLTSSLRQKAKRMQADPSFRFDSMVENAPAMMVLRCYLSETPFDRFDPGLRRDVVDWLTSWWRSDKLLADQHNELSGTLEYDERIRDSLKLAFISALKELPHRESFIERSQAMFEDWTRFVAKQYEDELELARAEVWEAEDRVKEIEHHQTLFASKAAGERLPAAG